MAHQVETMAYAGQKPWHGLGVQVDANIGVDDMLIAAGLDWQVQKQALHTTSGLRLKDTFALVRAGKTGHQDIELGVCGKNYVPVQNNESFEFFREFCEAGSLKLETAGSLCDGKKVFGLAKTQSGFELAGGDVTNDYVLLYSPFIWGKALTIMHTSIRVVCNNTLTRALSGAVDPYRFLHNGTFDPKVAHEKLGMISDISANRYAEAKIMSERFYGEDDVYDFLFSVFPPTSTSEPSLTRTATEVLNLIDTQPGANLASSEGTYWGLYNAVSYYVDHQAARTVSNRLDSAWFGAGSQTKLKAYNKALALAA